MSYRQELRAAELAVIEAAEKTWANATSELISTAGGPPTVVMMVGVEHFGPLAAAVPDLRALRAQLDAPIVPASDGDTSANAARLALPMVAGLRRKIIFAVAKHERYPLPGCSDDMLERQLQRSHQTVSAARRSLVQMGWLHDSGKRQNTRTGRAAVLWTLTGFGKDSVVKLALEVPGGKTES